MQAVIIVIHLMIAIALVGVVLLQKSEGGGLGMGGGGGGGMGGFMTGRSQANLLTRTTAILAGCFMLTSLVLAWLASDVGAPRSILDTGAVPAATEQLPTPPVGETGTAVPADAIPAAPAAEGTAEPAADGSPSVPVGK